MQRYVIRRLVQMVPILLGISIVVFALLAAAPGDQVDLLISGVPGLTPADVIRLKHVYGLDEPPHVRYVKWLERAAQGDFGWSRTYREPVATLILDRLGNTVSLAAGASETAVPSRSRDRKSTRLNSSHSQISYGVLCFKKKKQRRVGRAQARLCQSPDRG